MPISVEEFERMRSSVIGMRDALSQLARPYGPAPLPGSKGDAELRAFSRPESLHTAHSQAWMLMEVTADHLTAFIKTISEPVETVAPYTCTRSLLEASALACWLLDPSIDSRTRVSRSLALRFEGLEQQVKWAKAAGQDPSKGEQRLQHAAGAAAEIGFPPISDASGRVRGAGQRMPSITHIIGSVLGEEPLYRLLSTVEHGHSWALQQLSFERAPEMDVVASVSGAKLSGLVKGIDGLRFASLLLVAAESLAHAVWNQAVYFGWDTSGLSAILENAFDDFSVTDDARFWRAAT
jgi:hypothetical protein